MLFWLSYNYDSVSASDLNLEDLIMIMIPI